MLVKVNINGVDYEAKDNEKILSLCLKVGIFIPHLCYLNHHTPSGRCGLCVVDIDNGSVALSCLTTVKDNMVIKTESYAIDKIRRNNMARILKTHTTDCLRCFKSGRCALQRYITKVYEDSADNISSLSDKESKDVFTNITDNLLFNKSKCINCNRCVRFLCETCGMECKTVDVADYSAPEKDDLYGNVIDICPTAALKANDGVWKIEKHNTNTVRTHDLSNVFTPKIQVTIIDNGIVEIVSTKSVWIPNKIRFLKDINLQNDINIEDIVSALPSEAMDKKVFLIGDGTDIETMFIVKYITENYPSCLIVMDDSNIDHKVLRKNIGINPQDILKTDCAVFIGVNRSSERYYIKSCIRDLKKIVEVDDISSIPDLSEFKNPYIFIAAENFSEPPKLPFSIIPKSCSQMLIKFIEDYVPLKKFDEIYNRHDIKFVCIVGESDYSPKEGIMTFRLRGKHFISDSGYYLNAFNKVVQTNAAVYDERQSMREIFTYMLKILYKEESSDIINSLHSKMSLAII